MKTYKKQAKTLSNKKDKSTSSAKNKKYSAQLPSEAQQRNIFSTIDENFGFLNSIFGDGVGLVEGKYDTSDGKVKVGIAYIEGMSDKILISNQIVEPLIKGKVEDNSGLDNIPMLIQSKFISVPNIKQSKQMQQVVDSLLNGDTIIFIEGVNSVIIVGTRKVEKRAIEDPTNEVTVFASSDSFTEDLETNTSLVIRRLPTPDLHIESFTVGSLSNTKVKLIWIDGIANTKAVDEVRRRIEAVDIDNIDGIGALAELIEDEPWSIFPKYRQTQRPDMLVKGLTDGRFAILCSDSPFGIAAPISFWDNFKTMDGYNERFLVSTFLRIIRYFAFILATTISPLYLAFVAYNHSIVPPALALNISKGREGVPFPSFVEVIVMTLLISIIREASLRIPGSVGYFIGTLAAVTIGQSAVAAGYVSASVIIVVAVAAISSFAISATSLIYPARMISYLFILLAGIFGMFGLINGVIILLWHAVSQDSFGVPYLYPVVPFDLEGMKDTFIRGPLSTLKKRLRILAPFNRVRMGEKGIRNKNENSEGD